MTNANITFEIKRQQSFTADELMAAPEQALTKLGGCSDYDNKYGLGAWQMEFDVEVTNQEKETRQFTVVFQPEERNNGMKNYSGYDVTTAPECDVDESGELEQFCDYDDAVIAALHDIAQEKAKQELERLMSETTFLMNPATGSVDTKENWLAEMQEWEIENGQTPQEQFDSLVEVVRDGSGDWVEAE